MSKKKLTPSEWAEKHDKKIIKLYPWQKSIVQIFKTKKEANEFIEDRIYLRGKV